MDAIALSLRSVAHRERKLGHPELAGVIDGAAEHIEEAAAKIASDAATIARLTGEVETLKEIAAEGERYRRQLTAAKEQSAKFSALYEEYLLRADEAESRLLTIKKDTVEECAKVADEEAVGATSHFGIVMARRIARRLRSLATPSVPELTQPEKDNL